MTIPDYETLMLPVLRLFANGAKNVSECLPAIKRQFSVTEAEAEELLPSGRVTVLQSRTHWARTYLSKAGLLESPKRNLHVITALGRQVLAENPETIDNRFLDRFSSFAEWRSASGSNPKDLGEDAEPPRIDDGQTPKTPWIRHIGFFSRLFAMNYSLSFWSFLRSASSALS
ncbi:hypothetical protein OEW28_09300 [Defluviimonas sp. WL0002]|uniref:Restriction system protein Mrr-like N-terminal domain-containing protein n=1 Tax=Albidovulum marisflavi TaxID=2984159 RepID=A0ABT2ZCS6_9RHOB|nr:winged helix-turn-helix domain-containing protein [Defluviimonas sp. WL0002]MCV2868822.1 hypothetical protein [Defluviimonas sp. WL0002]